MFSPHGPRRHLDVCALSLICTLELGCDKQDPAQTETTAVASATAPSASAEAAGAMGKTGGDKPAPQTVEPTAPAAGAEDGDPPAREKPSGEELAARRAAAATYAKHLTAGRKATKAGDYAAAEKEYWQAIRHKDNDATAHGELGWAEFLADKLYDARLSTERALTFARTDKKRGALYYNLGRIAEAEGDLSAAAGFYKRSLLARENETVAKRLASIASKVPKPPGGDPNVDALCQHLLAERHKCEAAAPKCGCAALQRIDNANKASAVSSAAVLVIDDVVDGEARREFFFAIESKTGGWQEVAAVGEVSIFDALSSLNAQVESLNFVEVGGGDSAAVLRMKTQEQADDYHDHTYNGFEHDVTYACANVAKQIRCPSFETRAYSSTSSWDEGNTAADNERMTLSPVSFSTEGVRLGKPDGGVCSEAAREAAYSFAEFAALDCLYSTVLK